MRKTKKDLVEEIGRLIDEVNFQYERSEGFKGIVDDLLETLKVAVDTKIVIQQVPNRFSLSTWVAGKFKRRKVLHKPTLPESDLIEGYELVGDVK